MLEESDINAVKSILTKNLCVTNSLQMSSTIRSRRKLQHLSCLNLKDERQKLIYDFFMSYAYKSERDCPGSGQLFLKKLVGTVSQGEHIVCRTKKDLLRELENLKLESKLFSILRTCVDLSNIDTKVSIKKTSSKDPYVELIKGHQFYLDTLLSMSSLTLDRAFTICIDGYVESVSELHHLLEHFSENKQACLIFCRGLSNDVLHTIKVNNDRQIFSVYPYIVPFDVENVNVLVDLAVVTDTDVISSLKGNLISSFDVKDLGSVDSCVLSKNFVRFKSKSLKRTDDHVKQLLEKLEERPELETHISKRLRSLSAECIEVCIPDDINFYSYSQQLDEGIRVMSSILNKKFDPESTSNLYLEICTKNLSQMFVL